MNGVVPTFDPTWGKEVYGHDGLSINISRGTLVGFGQICFYSKRQLASLFSEGWQVLELKRAETIDFLNSECPIQAEWCVVVEKLGQ